MKILKWFGIIAITLAVLVGLFVYLKINDASNRLKAVYSITPAELMIPDDSATIARGSMWVNSLCADCHGLDLGGQLFFDEPDLGTIYAPNLTPGEGGVAYYTNTDWVRAIRHGVAPNGRPLLVMPAKDYANMTQEDLAATIAYLKTLAPVNRTNGVTKMNTFAHILLSVGAFGDAISAEVVDHEAAIPSDPENRTVLERGDYLVTVGGCATCHFKGLKGGKSPDPNSPPVPDITSTGAIASWSIDQYSTFLKSGKTPDGREVDGKFMPWAAIGRMPASDQQAIFEYLQSLP